MDSHGNQNFHGGDEGRDDLYYLQDRQPYPMICLTDESGYGYAYWPRDSDDRGAMEQAPEQTVDEHDEIQQHWLTAPVTQLLSDSPGNHPFPSINPQDLYARETEVSMIDYLPMYNCGEYDFGDHQSSFELDAYSSYEMPEELEHTIHQDDLADTGTPISDDEESPGDVPEIERKGLATDPYNKLIYECLKSATPYHEMQLNDIYKWFRENTNKRTPPNELGWKNSIRHNLSMNKAFKKGSRSDPENTTGSFWSLTDYALINGFEPTTRYRKDHSRRKEPPRSRRSRPAARSNPRRQASGPKNDEAAKQSRRSARSGRGTRNVRSRPKKATRRVSPESQDQSSAKGSPAAEGTPQLWTVPPSPYTPAPTPGLSHDSSRLNTPSSSNISSPFDDGCVAPYYIPSASSTPSLPHRLLHFRPTSRPSFHPPQYTAMPELGSPALEPVYLSAMKMENSSHFGSPTPLNYLNPLPSQAGMTQPTAEYHSVLCATPMNDSPGPHFSGIGANQFQPDSPYPTMAPCATNDSLTEINSSPWIWSPSPLPTDHSRCPLGNGYSATPSFHAPSPPPYAHHHHHHGDAKFLEPPHLHPTAPATWDDACRQRGSTPFPPPPPPSPQ